MPELPEVETVARGLAARMVGRRILKAELRRPDLRYPMPADLPQRLAGRLVRAVDRRAKYLLIHLDDGTVAIAHLGMSGRMLLRDGPYEPERHDHVLLHLEGGGLVAFNDARRFGMLDLATEATLAASPHLAGLGPEPLDPAFDGAVLARALAGRKTPIKAAILDQGVVAGVGNIYASEALFEARLSPRRLAMTVSGRRADRLAAAIKTVLQRAIAAGGSSLRDYVQADGELGYFQHQWAVYDREGQPCPGCRCAVAETGGIRRLVQSNRSTFWCPVRQR